jgi:hypothetical protein
MSSPATHPALDPRVTVLLRPSGSVQLGWDPETALLLHPPPHVEAATLEKVLRFVDGKHSRPQIMWCAAEHGIEPADMSAILAELEEVGLLDDVEARVTRSLSMRVHGRGPLADAIHTGLARMGVQLTRSRAAGHEDVSRWRADFVVLADDLVPDPRVVTDLVKLEIPHLQVRIRDGRGVVGPLVVPGRTSCLRCAELTRCGFDEEWPHVSAQMLGRVGYASPATILATAAVALGQLEAVLGGPPRVAPASLDATLEIDLERHKSGVRHWPRHNLCECWQSGTTLAVDHDHQP